MVHNDNFKILRRNFLEKKKDNTIDFVYELTDLLNFISPVIWAI